MEKMHLYTVCAGGVYAPDENPATRVAAHQPPRVAAQLRREREFFIDNLLVRIHFIIVLIRWTGLAPWEFEFPFPGSLSSTFQLRT